jgi:hypothetical protein
LLADTPIEKMPLSMADAITLSPHYFAASQLPYAAASQDFRRQPLRDFDADYAALTAMHFHFIVFTLFTATHDS